MNRIFKLTITSILALVLFTACTSNNENVNDDGKLKVVTSFTIIEDIAKEIGGDDIDVHNLVPTGTDPHEYEPLPQDIKKASDADVLFYNGLNLEGGKDGWFSKMIDSVGQDENNIYNLTERVDPMYLTSADGKDEEINPHSFIDPAVGIKMAEDLKEALITVDPENESAYEERGNAYIEKLQEINEDYERKISEIPEENRVLVTSERAFQYLANHFGLKEGYIWAIDTEENGSTDQIKDLIEFIEDNNVSLLFIESNVDTRPMETVSRETGIPIAQKPIFSDEIDKPGEEVDTYIKYLNYNIDLIYSELK